MDKRGPKGELHRAVVLDWKESFYVQVALGDLKESKERGLQAKERKEVNAVIARLKAVWKDKP